MQTTIQKRRKKSRRSLPRYLMPPDLAIMQFLWKWKLATGIVLYYGVSSKEKPRAFNKRLSKLEANGVIEDSADGWHRRCVWQLTDLGFSQIRQTLPDLKDKGFRSPSIDHDFACLALILGEWPFEPKANPEFFSDQELLRQQEDLFPPWVPQPAGHRADGYLKMREGIVNTCIAFEAELSFKSVAKYRAAIQFYKHERKIARVVWMYRDPFFLSQFLKAKADVREESSNFHLFLNEAEYLKDGWDAVLYNERSEKVLKFRELLQGNHGESLRELAGKEVGIAKISIFTDTRKYLNLKKTYAHI